MNSLSSENGESSEKVQIPYECTNCKRQANSEADKDIFKLCSGCYKARYCSRECQVADRRTHKIACKAKAAIKSNSNSTQILSRQDFQNVLYYCGKGDRAGLGREISEGINLKAAPNDLMFSAFNNTIIGGFYECAELLLQHNADPNAQYNNGFTPLIAACTKGLEEFAALFLRYNANPNIRIFDGSTALLNASHKGHDKCVALLLQKNADPNIRNNNNGFTPLHAACQEGHDKCVSLLLQHKADPNSVNRMDGFSPLHVACENGRDNCVSLLLKHNANPNIESAKCGYSPLHIACQEGHDKCVSLLLQHKANPNAVNDRIDASPLHLSCQMGHDKCVSLLLNAGGNTEYMSETGATPLLIACYRGHIKCVALLVEHGANIHSRNLLLHSALYCCCLSRNVNLVAYFLSLGVDVNVPDMHGVTPLQYCHTYGPEKCVKLLLEHGAEGSTMNAPIPDSLRSEQSMIKAAHVVTKEMRQQARHCDYPNCVNEGNADQPLQACSSCKAVYYCSRAHQEAHWKEHKKLCKAIKK